MEQFLLFFHKGEFRIIAAFIVAFAVTAWAIPIVIRTAIKKNLFAYPNGRTVHNKAIPTLGGLGIYSGLLVAKLLCVDFQNIPEFQFLIAGTIIIFMIGLKDDILLISWQKKLVGQLTAAIIIIILGNMRITNFYGLLGIHEIPYIVSVLFTIFVIIVIVNCLNLIDGIDGLAAGLAIVITATFGAFFLINRQVEYSVQCAALIGALLPFWAYNVYGNKNKIFMGDTGSLVIGFFIAMLVIKFCQANLDTTIAYPVQSAPAVAFGILMIPLYDTLRVFVSRMLSNGSPFKADKNHIHHILLRLGYSHLKSTIILVLVSIFFIILSFFLQDIGMTKLITVLIVLGAIFTTYLIHLNNIIKKKEKS